MSHTSYLTISSADRESSSISRSNFKYRLPNSLSDITKIVVDQVCIPAVWYTVITGYNDKIVIDVSSTDYNATLDPGVYTASELATEAQSKIRAAYTPDNNHSVSLDTKLYKFTISHTGTAFTIEWSQSNSANKLFGFESTDTSSTTSHTATNIYNLKTTNKVHIISNQLASRVNILGGNYRKTLFSAIANANFGEFIEFQNNGNHFVHNYGQQKDFYEIDFKLLFDDGTLIPLNGVDWSISLRFYATLKT